MGLAFTKLCEQSNVIPMRVMLVLCDELITKYLSLPRPLIFYSPCIAFLTSALATTSRVVELEDNMLLLGRCESSNT